MKQITPYFASTVIRDYDFPSPQLTEPISSFCWLTCVCALQNVVCYIHKTTRENAKRNKKNQKLGILQSF